MADDPADGDRYHETGDSGGSADDGPTAGRARWQTVIGIVGLIVGALVIILLLSGEHGPGRHGGGDGQQPQTNVDNQGGHDPSRRDH